MSHDSLPPAQPDVTLRARKPRSLASPRIRTLAKIGAGGGLLTPREIKEICQAVVADCGTEVLAGRRKNRDDH